MFSFMKKGGNSVEKDEKEKRKKEKKELKEHKKRERGNMTAEELLRLDEVRRSLKIRGRHKEKEKLPSGITADYSANFLADVNRDGDGKCTDNLTQSDSSEASLTSQRSLPPPTLPPRPPKRGILKQSSSRPSSGGKDSVCNIDDSTLVQNTLQNEVITYQNITQIAEAKNASGNSLDVVDRCDRWRDSSSVGSGEQMLTPPVIVTSKSPSIESLTDSTNNSSFTTPPFSLSPLESGQELLFKKGLPLPDIEPVVLPEPRELTIHRQPPPRCDFGFSLRRVVVVDRWSKGSGVCQFSAVVLAEPGITNNSSVYLQTNYETGLLPGDRLLEVNGISVSDKAREEIIEMIKSSGPSVTVKVQPVPELSELSRYLKVMSGSPGQIDSGESSSDDLALVIRRSASSRFIEKMAKSEEQLAQERTWLQSESERVWLVHSAGFSLVKQHSHCPQSGKVIVSLENPSEEIMVDEDDIEKANPPQLDRVDDLSLLRYLNESSALHTLRQRYGGNLIHTYTGESVIIMNPVTPLAPLYSEKVAQMFFGWKSEEEMPGHIYAVAQSVYRNAVSSRSDHSVIFLGHSASGKTVNYRHTLHYLVLAAGSSNKVLSLDKLNAIWSLLESFGHARTKLNNNATRLMHTLTLDHDHVGQIVSASIQILMCEKWRVVRQPEGELSFHIFYQLLAGAADVGTLHRDLFLNYLPEDNIFTTQLNKLLEPEEKQKLRQGFISLNGLLQELGISESEAKAIWCVVAAVMHLSSAGAIKGISSGRWHFKNPSSAEWAAQLLGISVDGLGRILQQQQKQNQHQQQQKQQLQQQTPSVTDSLHAVMVGFYSELLNTVAALINRSISIPVHSVCSLLIVDYPGFQNASMNGVNGTAGLFDFCNNYLSERLHLLFYQSCLLAPRDRYSQEQIEIPALDEIEDCKPKQIVQIFDQNRSTQSAVNVMRCSQTDLGQAIDHRTGILWLLDEVAANPSSTDNTFVEKIFSVYGDREFQRLLGRGPNEHEIVIHHFHSTSPVVYSTVGWLRESQENYATRSSATMLHESIRQDVRQLFVEGSRQRSHSSIATGAGTAAGIKRKSVSLQIKFAVDGLCETLRKTKLKFVHCFLPHGYLTSTEEQRSGLSSDLLMDIPLVRSQLRGSQILAVVRLHKLGFPKSLSLSEFRRRFSLLTSDSSSSNNTPTPSTIAEERSAVEKILESLDLDSSSYRLGLSRVFFRYGVLPLIEAQRDEKLTSRIMHFQSHCRGFLARKQLAQRKVQELAVKCIQRNVRKFLSVRNWSWWRLLVKITPLLNIHRTEEELQEKTEEVENLRSKVEKLEHERALLKEENMKLETKLNEIAIDLAEERSCATLASNHLELETAERIRLEKEVHEMQKEKRQLMENSESLEMELLCSRSGQLNGPSGDEVEDGAYKERYKQAIRELEFTRRRLQQQHQDDLEQLVGLKKQLEKKLADAYEEVEEQRQVVAQWKRKAQKLSAETNDLRLLLEEQNSRNNLLEKKQRKFDAEFQLLTDELRQEKANKERSCRDKELILGDKYALEQNINSLKLELELKDQKLLNLTQEHEELMFGGNTEEDVAQLKKVKHQLESKVKDQEEELDDLAGQVQLLEQAKLRLEMSIEQMRKEHRRELQQRDEEIEEVRCNAYKKAKSLECQLESEHEERTGLLRERHELERRLAEAEERLRSNNTSNQDLLHKLRRDLKRTKVLLRDAQMTIEQTRGEGSNKAVVRQLRNQVEDAECARAAAVKGRQTAEAEAAEAVASMEEATRARTELEERLVAVTRDRAQIQSQLDENEEELAEVLKKYRAAVQQLSTEQAAQQEQASHVAQLESERASLREQLAELNSRLENMETLSDPSSSLTAKMLQIKNKELESKLDLEQTTRSRLEIQIARLRETTERLQADITASRVRENSAHEATRKMSRSLREAKEEQQLLMVREADYNSKCQELEKKLETSEAETAAAKFDLRLAMQRIEDLQCALEGDMEDANVVGSDSDLESGGSSDDSLGTYLANHNVHSSSNSHGSLDSVVLEEN
ncbi:unconventional myosin-XVIIIa-like isoform X2 [Lycorma delicatula]|uniref:unconventional myosin-XVIIIa-like isoform X2 n=1 Tax=Lycorma delicatula TaxID=130591 RepID=UPI003F50D9E1